MYKWLAVVALAVVCGSSQAADWGFGFSFGEGHSHRHDHCAPPTPYRSPIHIGIGIRKYGHYETIREEVCVEYSWIEKIHVSPVYETRRDEFGNKYKVLIQEGYCKEVVHPARYEVRYRTVYIRH